MENLNEQQVRTWLETALNNEDLAIFSFNLTGNTEKGSGYWGDVIFVDVEGTSKQGVKKEYSLVLKCDKSSEAFKKLSPVFHEPFKREIYFYQEVVPCFQQLQRELSIGNPFNSLAKCYGVHSDASRKVIIMDNLKSFGYEMYNMKNPLTRTHINLLVREYAKFHAISVVLRERQPEKFQELANNTQENILRGFFKETDFVTIIKKTATEAYNLLKDDLEKEVLSKWLALKDEMDFIFYEMIPDAHDLQVLTHGDCWNNNFMFKYNDDEKKIISHVKILDWQLTNVSSPVLDLSYFLFSCIGPQDVADLNTIVEEYHCAFSEALTKMGSTFSKTYSLETFFQEWKKYAKFGVGMCQLLVKAAFMEKSDVPDMVDTVEKGGEINSSFDFEINNTNGFKNRMRPIIEYAFKNGLM